MFCSFFPSLPLPHLFSPLGRNWCRGNWGVVAAGLLLMAYSTCFLFFCSLFFIFISLAFVFCLHVCLSPRTWVTELWSAMWLLGIELLEEQLVLFHHWAISAAQACNICDFCGIRVCRFIVTDTVGSLLYVSYWLLFWFFWKLMSFSSGCPETYFVAPAYMLPGLFFLYFVLFLKLGLTLLR